MTYDVEVEIREEIEGWADITNGISFEDFVKVGLDQKSLNR